MASHTTQQPMFEKRRSGRRPTRSTRFAPSKAHTNCWQLLIKVTFAWPNVLWIPTVSRTLPRKYDNTAKIFSKILNQGRPHTIASPLTKNRNAYVAEKSIASRLVLEKRAVIPPSFIGSVHFEQFLIFIQLQCHPLAVGVPVPVKLGEHSLGSVSFIVDVQPSWGFREKVCDDEDYTREHELNPDNQTP